MREINGDLCKKEIDGKIVQTLVEKQIKHKPKPHPNS